MRDRQGERVAAGHGRCRGCAWREVEWPGFIQIAETDVGFAQSRQMRVITPRNAETPHAVIAENGGEFYDFGRAAGVTQQHYDVLASDGPEVAVYGIGRMDEV